MSQAAVLGDSLAFGDVGDHGTANGRWMVPVMIGIAFPVVIVSALGFVVTGQAQVFISLMLVFLLLATTVLFVLSAILPKDLVGIVADRKSRQIDLISQNALVTSTASVPFDSIRKIEVSGRYRNGEASSSAVLVLEDGSIAALPADFDEAQVKALKELLRLA